MTNTNQGGPMRSKVEIEAGICGFRTVCSGTSDDEQHVTLEIVSDCEKVRAFALRLSEKGALDALQEINPKSGSILLSTARDVLKGCCGACAAPIGAFKAMQVAAGLALPKDVNIKISKE
jgi:hypothetical protein